MVEENRTLSYLREVVDGWKIMVGGGFIGELLKKHIKNKPIAFMAWNISWMLGTAIIYTVMSL